MKIGFAKIIKNNGMIYSGSRWIWEKYIGKVGIITENDINTAIYEIHLIQLPWNQLKGLNGVNMQDKFFIDRTHVKRYI